MLAPPSHDVHLMDGSALTSAQLGAGSGPGRVVLAYPDPSGEIDTYSRSGFIDVQNPFQGDSGEGAVAQAPCGICQEGARPGDEIEVDAFLAQADDYESTGDLRDGVLKLLNTEKQTHPFAVVRAAELRLPHGDRSRAARPGLPFPGAGAWGG